MPATTIGTALFQKAHAITVTAAQSPCTIILGPAVSGRDICAGTWVFQTKCANWSGNTIDVKSRVISEDLVTGTDDLNKSYQREGATTDIAAGTQITLSDIYYVRTDWQYITLLVTVNGADVIIVPNGGPG